MADSLPHEILQRREQLVAQRREPLADGPPRPGDIRPALPMDPGHLEPRWVLVLSTSADRASASVALVATETDAITDADVRFERQESGAAFTVVVQTDVVAPLWRTQLGPPAGRLSSEWTRRLAEAGIAGPQSIDPARRGLPLPGRTDRRWGLKQEEVRHLQALAGDRIRDLVEGEVAFADPGALRAALQGDDRAALAVTAEAELRQPPADVLLALLDSLDELKPERLVMLERLLNVTSDATVAGDAEVVWSQRPAAPGDEVQRWREKTVVAAISGGRRRVRLRTTRSCWSTGEEPLAATVHGNRVQVDADLVEA